MNHEHLMKFTIRKMEHDQMLRTKKKPIKKQLITLISALRKTRIN
jgi:hypothetical protein